MGKKKHRKKQQAAQSETTIIDTLHDQLSELYRELSDIRHDTDTVEMAHDRVAVIEEKLNELLESPLLDSERYIIYEKEKDVPMISGVDAFLSDALSKDAFIND